MVRGDEVKERLRRQLLPPSLLFGLPTCSSLSCQARPPAIRPLRLTSRVGAIKSRSTCKFITNIRKLGDLICRLSKFTKLQAIWDFTITIACKFCPLKRTHLIHLSNPNYFRAACTYLNACV